MIQLFRDSNFDFVGRRRWAYVISILFILAGLGSMVAKGGLRYGIDFSGGTLIQVRFEKPVSVDRIRQALETVQMGESVIQEFGDTREYLLRLPLAALSSEEVTRRTQDALAKDLDLGQSVALNAWKYYFITVPAGATNLTVATTNATADVDLYTQFNVKPTSTTYICRPFTSSGNETCSTTRSKRTKSVSSRRSTRSRTTTSAG